MTSANLPINLETTPLFKDYVSNVKKHLVKTKHNSESKREGTRLQVARKSTSWHRSRMIPTFTASTAASPTPVISGTVVNSTSILSPICEGENGSENDQDEKNEEKERARTDGTDSPVDADHDRQATPNSQLLNQHSHSPKDITENEEKEEDEDVCKQSNDVVCNTEALSASTPSIIDTGDKTASISTLTSEFDKTNKLDNEHSVKIEEEDQAQNEDYSSSINQHFNSHTSSNKKSLHNHEYNHSHENKKEDPDKEKKGEKEKEPIKQNSRVIVDSMATTSSTTENAETTDSITSAPFEEVDNMKQQKDQDKKPEDKERFKRKLSCDNTDHVSREKTIRNCSPPPESFKEEDKLC